MDKKTLKKAFDRFKARCSKAVAVYNKKGRMDGNVELFLIAMDSQLKAMEALIKTLD